MERRIHGVPRLATLRDTSCSPGAPWWVRESGHKHSTDCRKQVPLTQSLDHHRPVRSYVRRSGRMTPAQRRALDRYLPSLGLPTDRLCDLSEAFGRDAPRCVEIGFGTGDALLEMAGAFPERDYLGVEVHEPGIGRLLHQAAARGLTNLRVIVGDAVEVLARCLPESALHDVYVFFPDPWPKKRHHKRRLVSPHFVRLVASRLVPGGRFLLATDWPPYAEHILAVLESEPTLQNLAGRGQFAPNVRRSGRSPASSGERRASVTLYGISRSCAWTPARDSPGTCP